MMNDTTEISDVAEIELSGTRYFIHKLSVWDQIKLGADLQKEVIKPLAAEFGADLGELEKGEVNVGAVVSGISQALDGNRIEYWTKLLLGKKIVAYERDDGAVVRLDFIDIGRVLTDPVDVLALLIEVLKHNFFTLGKDLAARIGQGLSGMTQNLPGDTQMS